MKIKRNLQFHQDWFLLLSPAFIVVHGFARFPEAISWSDIVWLFLEYSTWSMLIAFFLSWFLPFRRAALFAFVLVLFNSLYSNIYEYSLETNHTLFFTRSRFVFPLVFLVFILLFIFFKKTAFTFNRTTRFLNFLFMLLIAIEVGQFSFKLYTQKQNAISIPACEQCRKPDVYLIITDGYAGRKQLQEQLEFDNYAFEDSLSSFGFHLVDSSLSNYGSTGASMASLMNMQYITVGKDDDIHAKINRSGVVRFFQNMGYELVNHSIFKMGDEFPKQPTTYFKTGTVLITQHSFFSHLEFVIHNLLFDAGIEYEKQRVSEIQKQTALKERNRDSITMQDLLATVRAKESTPRFVYTHFIMPHPPYLFDRNGKQLNMAGAAEAKYIEYLQYTNGKLLSAVETILKGSAKPPIILLLSDHGYRNDDDPVPNPQRFYNLAAVYLPDKNYKPYHRGMSNVNQLRVLLNNQFGQKLELLRDSVVY